MPEFWKYEGKVRVRLTTAGIASHAYAKAIRDFGHLMVSEHGVLNILPTGGCQQSVNGITVSFSHVYTDCVFFHDGLIECIENADGKTIWEQKPALA